MAMPVTPAAWMIAGRPHHGQDVPADDPRVAQPEDAGGVDVQLVADRGDRAEDDAGRRPATSGCRRSPWSAQIDGPRTARAASSTTMPGSAISRLVTQENDGLTSAAVVAGDQAGGDAERPRRRPARPGRPRGVIRVAKSSREKMSWPEPSAPSRWSPLGGARMSRAAARLGSSVASTGARSATTTSSTRKARDDHAGRVLQQPPEQRRVARSPPGWRRRGRSRRGGTRS